MSNYLIFGGAGSFGTRMTEYILKNTEDNITIFSRGEKQQWEHKLKFSNSPRIKYIIGDIRDREAVDLTMEDADYVFLAAAMKHIDRCEQNPFECYKTNISGCINVIDSAIEHNVKKLVFLSTDKAVNPTTIYGCSKLFIEMYMQSVDNKNTELIRTRYGNVFGSNGSVAWVFNKLSKEGKPLTVTNPHMTRFFMKLDEAVELVWTACHKGVHRDLWVYNNKSCTIKELADAFSDNQIVSGLRSVEKNDEALLATYELDHSERLGNYYRINKNIPITEHHNKPLTSDNCERLTHKELLDLIQDWRDHYNV